jgi:hypothetical protein
VNTADDGPAGGESSIRNAPSSRSPPVADLGFVLLTVVLFAALTVLIRAVERW